MDTYSFLMGSIVAAAVANLVLSLLKKPIASEKVVESEAIIKSLQQKYETVRDQMKSWDELKSQLLSQYQSYSFMLNKLYLVEEFKNYGDNAHIKDIVIEKQLMKLEREYLKLEEMMPELHCVVDCLKIIRGEASELVAGASTEVQNQLEQGIRQLPTASFCVKGLEMIHARYESEYDLESSLISKTAFICRPSKDEIDVNEQILRAEPHINEYECQAIFDRIFT